MVSFPALLEGDGEGEGKDKGKGKGDGDRDDNEGKWRNGFWKIGWGCGI